MTAQQIITQRESTHGDFTDNSAVAQSIKTTIRHHSSHLSDVQAEALDFIASKIGRICSGNANERDHWLDIAGYATLAADRIQIEHPELTFQVDTYTGIPASKDVYKVPTGWRLMSGNDRVDTLSRCHCTDGWKEFHPTMYGREFHQWVADGYACITPDWHNPCNVESPGEGYRFLLKGEKRHEGTEFTFSRNHSWQKASRNRNPPLDDNKTYRTSCPLPTIS